MEHDIRRGWKCLTHDLRSPLQGGAPIFDGHLPAVLPSSRLDTGANECAAGWNYTAEPHTALAIGGFWPTGRPSRLFAVEAALDAIERGNKRRASSLSLIREATEDEVATAITAFSVVFGAHASRMANEQRAWRLALRRPQHRAAVVELALTDALTARKLPWSVKRFDTAWAAWAAWAALDARDARAARDAWAARDARAALDAWAAWDARAARAAWDARDARAARAAWAALTVAYASLAGWITQAADHLTLGMRDAYAHGLGIALPIAPTVLGWAMDATPEQDQAVPV